MTTYVARMQYTFCMYSNDLDLCAQMHTMHSNVCSCTQQQDSLTSFIG